MSNITRLKNGESVTVSIGDVAVLEETFNKGLLGRAAEAILEADYDPYNIYVKVNKVSYWAATTLLTFMANHMMLNVRATEEGTYVSYFFLVSRSPAGVWTMNKDNVVIRVAGDKPEYADEFDELEEIDVLNLLFGR